MVKIKPQGSAVGTSWILTRNFSVAAAFFLSFFLLNKYWMDIIHETILDLTTI
jgi:hypothetical protein